MKMKELAEALSISKSGYGSFRTAVKQLIEGGALVKLKRGRIGIPDEMNITTGQMAITKSGTGFLIREGEDRDILIPAARLHNALHGDKVMVRLTGLSGGRPSGIVIKVIERAQTNVVGIFRQGPSFAFVVPDNSRFHRDLYIPSRLTLRALEGEKVVAVLTSYDDPSRNPEGKIIERLGMPTARGVDMLTIMRSYNLPDRFPAKVLSQAEEAAEAFDSGDTTGRLDLSGDCIYTIDPADAKDHDDAVSVRKTKSGYRLGVHIADVSHFVRPGTMLDKEAFLRGNSVYLPGMVVPMLPELLSNDVCSLKVNRRRLAHSVFIEFNGKGEMLRWELADTIIKSKAKLAYEEVQQFFDDGSAPPKIARVAENLGLARKLSQLLSKRRFAQGSLDFDLPEAKIILNDRGEVLELGHRVRLESHRLVEEFMLVANQAVALEIFRKALPFIYRVHDRPDLEKLQNFSHMMTRLGYRFPVSPTIRPIDMARFLERVKDVPEADFINELMLRSMQKAVYQRKNLGHFGLAFTHYTHFTSPIRRYPDLLVHRLLRQARGGKYPPAFAKRIVSVIDNVGKHCSETERVAESAERQAVKVKQVAFMARHVGDLFGGIISGVNGYGFFVRLDNLGVEGFVRVSSLDDDYYSFDEKSYSLVGRRNRRSFRLGDKIEVGVMRVDKLKSELDLFVVDDQKRPGRKSSDKTPKPGSGQGAKKGSRRGRKKKG